MEPTHPPDVDSSLMMTFGAVLDCGFHGVQRRKMTRETLKVGPHHVDLVAGRFGDLRPLDLFVEMATFANPAIQTSVRRDLFDMGGSPAPHDSGPILNVLLMADMTVDFLVRALAPALPGRFHNVTGATETRVVLNIIIEAISA